MNTPPKFTILEVVNNAIHNARESGHELDAETIAKFWKVARKEISGEEIAEWKQDMCDRISRKRLRCGHFSENGPSSGAISKGLGSKAMATLRKLETGLLSARQKLIVEAQDRRPDLEPANC
ncbi:MAG: hypothetical protein J0G97_15950 [Rhizobium pusense]|nr:hypothetical protein [Agrobacterium pusense]